MNLAQCERQLPFLLKAATLPDAPNAPVLGDAFLSTLPPESFVREKTVPYAVIEHLEGDDDPAQPGRLGLIRFGVSVVAQVVADRAGSSALVGGSVPSIGKPAGRGAAQLVAELIAQVFIAGSSGTIGFLTDSVHGMQGRVEKISAPAKIQGLESLAVVRFEVAITNGSVTRFYHPIFKPNGSGGGGTNTITWTLGPARFDKVGVIAVRKLGSAPTSATDGTNLNLANGATSLSDSPGAGNWWYGVSMAYDEVSATPTTPQRYSSPTTFNLPL